jgi:surface polysaccharide O-acyltransferase-like enzyme
MAAAAETRTRGDGEPAAPVDAGRLAGLDALKGLAIIGVVAIHAPPSGAPLYFEHVVNGVLRLAVPLFLVISGYLLGSRAPSRAKAFSYFRKFLRLQILYGALYWLLDPLRGVPHVPVTPKVALMHFAAFAYPGQFYLFALLQIYLVLACVPERWWRGTALLAGSSLLCLGTLLLAVWSFRTPDGPWLLRTFGGHAEASATLWLFPFCLGMWLAGRSAHAQRAPAGGALCLALALAAVGVTAFDWPSTGGEGFRDHFAYARGAVLLGAVLLALAVPYASRALRLPGVAALGRESFGIFVMNPLLIGMLKLDLVHAVTVWDSLLFAAAALGITYALSRFLRPRVPLAFP